jgi:iron complex transport system ATP-binding protein
MSTTLSAHAIEFSYGGPPVLRGVDLACSTGAVGGRGDFVALIGPNGAGKSTLLQILTGFLKPDAGRVELNGREIGAYRRREVARHIAYVPQRAPVGFGFTVAEMVLMGRQPYSGLAAFDGPDDLRCAQDSLEAVGVSHLSAKQYDEISGGEQQLTLLARALAQDAPILVLDEPTAALDLHAQWHVLSLLGRKCAAQCCVVATVHDLNLASRCCTRMVLLHEGRVAAEGTPREVLERQTLESVYRLPLRVEERANGLPHVEFPE